MALYIPHSIFHLAPLLYVRPETVGPYYACHDGACFTVSSPFIIFRSVFGSWTPRCPGFEDNRVLTRWAWQLHAESPGKQSCPLFLGCGVWHLCQKLSGAVRHTSSGTDTDIALCCYIWRDIWNLSFPTDISEWRSQSRQYPGWFF